MFFEVFSFDLLFTEIAIQINVGAVSLYMLSKTSPIGIQRLLTELAVEFVTIVVSHMIIEFLNAHPFDLRSIITSMRELALIDEITHIWVHFRQCESAFWTPLDLVGARR